MTLDGTGMADDSARQLVENEKDELASRLNEAYEQGAVGFDEYQEIRDHLFTVQTRGDLVSVAKRFPNLALEQIPAVAVDAPRAAPGLIDDPSLPVRIDQASSLRLWVAVSGGLLGLVVILAIILIVAL